MKKFLHVGCGDATREQTTIGRRHPEWSEVRLDVDTALSPDILASIADMSVVPDAAFDALYSSHNIEHLYAHEVPRALAEFRRVLKPDGFAVIICPDLQSVAALIVENRLTEEIAPGMRISPMDVLYGDRSAIADGRGYMAHHCGFTAKVLHMSLFMAGFGAIKVAARPAPYFDLWALATVRRCDDARLKELVSMYIPATR